MNEELDDVNTRVVHVRLYKKELKFIDEYHNGSPTNFMRSALKKEMDLVKKNKKKSVRERYAQSLIMLGFGAIFIIYSLNTNNLLAFLIVFLLGVFFMMNGLSSIGVKLFRGIFQWKKKTS